MPFIDLGAAGRREVRLDIQKLIPTRLLVVANSGQGKTWALRRCAEQMHGKIPVWIIDPEGEFYTLREKFDYLLVGEGGEVPADVRIATKLVETLLETRASVIFDLFEAFRTRPSDRQVYVKAILEAMLNAPRKLWHPTVVILDEAHTMIPEKGDSVAAEAARGLCTAGRKRGFVAVLASQRLAALDKNASALCMNRIVGGTFEDVDVDRAVEMLSISKDDKFEFKKSLRVLEPGSFYALGRAITKERLLFKVGPVQTTHPEAGKVGKLIAPAPSEKILAMLPTLADLPKVAEAEAKTVAELKAAVRDLKAQLRLRPLDVSRKTDVSHKPDATALDAATMRGAAQARREHEKEATELRQLVSKLRGGLQDIHARAVKLAEIPAPPPAKSYTAALHLPSVHIVQRPPSLSASLPQSISSEPAGNGEVKLRDGARRMIGALCQWHPEAMTVGQVRAHAGLKKSGTFSSYMSDLRRYDLVREDAGLIMATDKALELFGTDHEAPTTTAEVLAIWGPKLRDGARRMLNVLVAHGGEPISREQLGEEAGLMKSGTFSSYLSDLRTARLAVTDNQGNVLANRETLFL